MDFLFLAKYTFLCNESTHDSELVNWYGCFAGMLG